MWHGFIAVEDLNLSALQRAALFQVLRTLSPATITDQPKYWNQFRLSLDKSKAILEMLFDEDDLSVFNFKQLLATMLDVPVASINDERINREYGWSWTAIWTFSHGVTNYFRVAMFGSPGADWLQSRDAAMDYVQQNLEDWEDDE